MTAKLEKEKEEKSKNLDSLKFSKLEAYLLPKSETH